jgi:hypothetical protein
MHAQKAWPAAVPVLAWEMVPLQVVQFELCSEVMQFIAAHLVD